jgi:hypothetical protein
VIAGIIVYQPILHSMTIDFLDWKRKYFPRITNSRHYHDHIIAEIKGSDLRKGVRSSGKKRKFSLLVINEYIKILERYGVNILGRVWIKGIGQQFTGKSVYTYSVQDIFESFNKFCNDKKDFGFVIADSRNKPGNELVSHSIFTQKFKVSGDAYKSILEMPTFGHSGNHAGIQMVDMLSSSLLFPMASFAYCTGHVTNHAHVSPAYFHLNLHYGQRLKRLQFRYLDATRGWRGGITVNDAIQGRNGGLLFQKPIPAVAPVVSVTPPVMPVIV